MAKNRVELKADFFQRLAIIEPQQALLPAPDRGVDAAIDSLVLQLEANNPISDPLDHLQLLGAWQLVYASRRTVVTRRLMTMPNFDAGIQISRVWQILLRDGAQGIRTENGARLEFLGLGELELKALGQWTWQLEATTSLQTATVAFDAFTFQIDKVFGQSSWSFPQLKIPILEVLRNEASSTTSSTLAHIFYGLLYLPPYSPDLNPIEHQWFVLKNRMRKLIQSGQPFRDVVDNAFSLSA